MKPICELVEKYKNRWEWCTLCRCSIIVYTCCGNTTCNGGGCDKCDETYDEAREISRAGLDPKITDIAGAVDRQRQHDINYYMQQILPYKEDTTEWNEWFARWLERERHVPFHVPSEEEQKVWVKPKSIFE